MNRKHCIKASLSVMMMVMAVLSLGGVLNAAHAFSVDVDHLFYSEPTGSTTIDYDFSSGTYSSNTITLPASAITQSNDPNDVFTFEVFPDIGNMTLSAPNGGSTLATGTDNEGAAILKAQFATTPFPSNAWVYRVVLDNFSGVTDPEKEYQTEIGLVSPLYPLPQPLIEVCWTSSGELTLLAEIYDEQEDQELFASDKATLTGIPADTCVELQIDNNNTQPGKMIFSYRINGAAEWTVLGTYTIPGDISFYSFPDRFPYVYLDEEIPDSPFQVSSHHWQGGEAFYNAWVWVDDEGQSDYSAVSVESAGYLPETQMVFNAERGYWELESGPVLLSRDDTHPTTPVTFTFTATGKSDGQTETVSKTITGYVEEFATNLAPTGGIATNPVFSWTGITGATDYGVELYDANMNRLWNKYDLPSTTNIAYDGPPLENGQTYTYDIVSTIETDGMSNNSFARGTFIYNGTIPVPPGPHPEATAIQSRFEAAMARANAEDFTEETGFAGYVSDNYLDFGETKLQLIEEVQWERQSYGPITWTLNGIFGQGDDAAMNLTWADGDINTLYFYKENEVWQIYGNQKRFDVWGHSGHNLDSGVDQPFWVSFAATDPDDTSVMIQRILVKGPGLPTEGIQLHHDTEARLWHSWSLDPFQEDFNAIWSSRPGLPLAYQLTIAYLNVAEGETLIEEQSVLIESFVDAAPARDSLSPAAESMVTRPLVFSWDSAGAGYRYRVEITDVNGNQIWAMDDLAETSVAYNGPVLGGGQYRYQLVTEDGYENISMISTAFQMPLLYSRTPVTSGGGTDNHPAWSPDGRQIAFTSNRSGADNIWVVDWDGANLRQLTSFSGDFSAGYPAWSPDGTRISYIVNEPAPNPDEWTPDGGFFLNTMNADGSARIRHPLPPASNQDQTDEFWRYTIWFTEWLDDDRIAFVSWGPEGGTMKMYYYRLSDQSVTGIVPDEINPNGAIYKISWNRELGKLAFDRWPIGIQTVSADGTGYTVLDIPNQGQMDTPGMPGWRADGQQLAFVKDVYNLSNIGIFDLASKTSLVEGTDTDDKWPVWSPDGGLIAFVSNGKIWTMTIVEPLLGDLNDDRQVDLKDALVAFRVLVGGEAGVSLNFRADVDGDYRAGQAELVYILQSVAGIRP